MLTTAVITVTLILTTPVQVDAEGFSIRPEFDAANKEDDSSSFSDEDENDPSRKKGFNVVIRPLEESNGAGGGKSGDGVGVGGGGTSSAEAIAVLVKSARILRSPSQVSCLDLPNEPLLVIDFVTCHHV